MPRKHGGVQDFLSEKYSSAKLTNANPSDRKQIIAGMLHAPGPERYLPAGASLEAVAAAAAAVALGLPVPWHARDTIATKTHLENLLLRLTDHGISREAPCSPLPPAKVFGGRLAKKVPDRRLRG